jgi:HlyD family secretion protein/epimerase transport system membrane fusion protein
MSGRDVAVIETRGTAVAAWGGSVPFTNDEPGPLKISVRAPVRKGYALIFLFVGGFGAWASLAPLESGAIAPGVISTDSSRRTVQHLEGGIIRDLRVREGDVVKAGQLLLVLEPVQPKANYDMLLAQKRTLFAQKARLVAEKTGAKTIAFPAELVADGKLTEAAASQLQIFETRRHVQTIRKRLLKERVEQFGEQIKGYRTQIASLDTQLSYIREEVANKMVLLQKGLLQRPEALRLKRNESELMAQRASFETEISKTKQQIDEANLQIVNSDATYLDEIAAETDKVDNALVEAEDRLRASRDVLKRTEITAPVSGRVINLRFKTVGGVVQRGEPILEIVPRDDRLMIEARVSPDDIPLVHKGQTARIHLDAYSSRLMPRLEGIVRSVSADRVTDGNGLQSHYLARVEIDKDELKKRASNVELIPGMSAEVIFVTQKRTLLQYLLTPMMDVLRRGLRES